MNDDDYIDVTPQEELTKEKNTALAHLLSGFVLMVLTIGARFRLIGIVLSATLLIYGLGNMLSRDRKDKKQGLIMTIAGVLGLAVQFGIPMIRPFSMFILGLGAMGFFASGLIRGIQNLLNKDSRR